MTDNQVYIVSLKSRHLWKDLSFVIVVFVLLLFGLVTYRGELTAVSSHRDLAQFPGFTVAQAVSGDERVIVTSVQNNSAASQTGIAVGDQIEVVNRHRVTSLTTAFDDLRYGSPTDIRVTLLHNHVQREVLLARHVETRNGA